MHICNQIAGFSLTDTDRIRKSLGKKDIKILQPYKEQFIKGCNKYGLEEKDSNAWWEIMVGCSDYIFNKSHSISYSFITYYCAYLKANYPHEFYTALMSVRAMTEQPKKWATKAPEYVNEAKYFGIEFSPPDINNSEREFKITKDKIYFGLASIKGLGEKVCTLIINERGEESYNSIWDFVQRTNLDTGTIQALTHAGALDSFGYKRESILENLDAIANYHKDIINYNEHILKQKERVIYNDKTEILKNELEELLKTAKASYKFYKKDTSLMSQKDIFLLDKANLTTLNPSEIYEEEWKNELLQYVGIRKLPPLKDKSFPQQPVLANRINDKLSLKEIILQAEHIGCYLTKHPARIIYPETTELDSLEEGSFEEVAGVIIESRIINTKNGQEMAIITINDSSNTAKAVIFPREYYKLKKTDIVLSEGSIVKIYGEIKKIEPIIDIAVKTISIYNRSINE